MYFPCLRAINHKIVFGLLLLLITCAPASEKETIPDVVTLLHITDTHVSDLEGYHPAIVDRRQQYGDSYLLINEFFRSLPGEVPPAAVIITGDIIDYYEGETDDSTMRNGQVEFFAKLHDRSPVPLLMTLGNHDISTYLSGVDEGTKSTLYDYNADIARASFIRTIACFSEGTYYSRQYRAGQTKYRLIFLDNALRVPRVLNGFFGLQQLHWLEYQLLAAENETVVLFYHIPIPVADTNQDNIHFRIPPAGWLDDEVVKDGFMNLLNTYPAIVAAFTGHGHRNIIEDMLLPAGHSFTQIETAALGNNLSNWRIIQLRENEIVVSAPGDEIVEKRIIIVQ